MPDKGQSREKQTEHAGATQDRWSLIRDIGVLQVKLIVDGLRDFILVPVSLVAGLASLVKSNADANNDFYSLLRMGKQSERWINLFGAADRVAAESAASTSHAETDSAKHGDSAGLPVEDIDALVNRLETFVVDEYRKGSVTGPARQRIERALESLHKMSSRKSGKNTGRR